MKKGQKLTFAGFVTAIPQGNETQEQIEKAAQLRRAAPVLLAACKAAHVSLIGDEHYQEFQEVIKTLEAAISIAEGRRTNDSLYHDSEARQD